LDRFAGNRDWIVETCFVPDESQLLSANFSGTIRIHDLTPARQSQRRLADYTWFRPVYLSMTNDGATLASVTAMVPDFGHDAEDGQLTVWNTASGQPVWQAAIGSRDALDVAIAPKGEWLVTCGKGSIRMWDLRKRQVTHVLAEDPEYYYVDASCSADGRWLAAVIRTKQVMGQKQQLIIWDAQTMPPRVVRIARIAPPLDDFFASLAFDDSNKHLAVSHTERHDGKAGQVDVFALVGDQWSESPVSSTTIGSCAVGLSFLPDSGDWLLCRWTGDVMRIRLNDPDPVWKVHLDDTYSVAATPDCRQLALGHNRAISLWDPEKVDELATIQTDIWVSSLMFTPDGRTLIWGGGDGSVHFERTE
jgi:WD40 repeat protein